MPQRPGPERAPLGPGPVVRLEALAPEALPGLARPEVQQAAGPRQQCVPPGNRFAERPAIAVRVMECLIPMSQNVFIQPGRWPKRVDGGAKIDHSIEPVAFQDFEAVAAVILWENGELPGASHRYLSKELHSDGVEDPKSELDGRKTRYGSGGEKVRQGAVLCAEQALKTCASGVREKEYFFQR